ncbi:MAG: tetratricopeptide repeat protein [Candidatus Omnitrophota bacterium]|jgi:TolA-binding protein
MIARLPGLTFIGIAAVIATIFTSPAHASAGAEEADLAIVKSAFNDGLYDLAQEKAEAFLSAYPHTAYLYDAHLLLGRSLYYQNDPRRALYELGLVLDAPGGSRFEDEALYWTAEIAFNNDDFKKALELYQRIIDAFPSSRYLSYAHYSKGWCYYKLGFLEEAIVSFRDVISKFPFDKVAVESQFRIGECEYLLERYDVAEKEIEAFLHKFPVSEKSADAYYLSGEISFHNEKYEDSIKALNKALSITPLARWSLFATYRMACAYLFLGDNAKSIDAFKRCAEGSKRNDFLAANSLLGLAKNYKITAKYPDAIAACDEVISLFPESGAAPEAYYVKSQILYDEGVYHGSETVSAEGIEKFPDSEFADELHYQMGKVLLVQERFDDAVAEFMWVKENSKDGTIISDALCRIGAIYFDRREYKNALEYFDAVLKDHSGRSCADYAQYQLGNIFYELGRYDQAVLAYKSLLLNFPDSTFREDAVLKLAMAYFMKKDFENAGTEFEISSKSKGVKTGNDEEVFYYANSLYFSGRYEEAAEAFKNIRDASRDERFAAMAEYQLGWSYHNMHKEADAMEVFTGFLKRHPGSVMAGDVLFWFGEYYRQRGEYKRSREYYSSVLRDFPSGDLADEAAFQSACSFVDEGKDADALTDLRKFVAVFPSSGHRWSAYRKMAALARKENDPDGAIALLREAITAENTDSNAQLQYEIAEIYEMKRSFDEAAAEYLKVSEFYPKGVFWSVRGMFKSAQLSEELGLLDRAKMVYEKLAVMDVEESKAAKEKLKYLSNVK